MEHYTFISIDPRGCKWRRRIQMIFYELLNRNPHIALDELRVSISLSQAHPFDILFLRKFTITWCIEFMLTNVGNWLIANLKCYHAMQACIAIINLLLCTKV